MSEEGAGAGAGTDPRSSLHRFNHHRYLPNRVRFSASQAAVRMGGSSVQTWSYLPLQAMPCMRFLVG